MHNCASNFTSLSVWISKQEKFSIKAFTLLKNWLKYGTLPQNNTMFYSSASSPLLSFICVR